jgi:hypothetical protein
MRFLLAAMLFILAISLILLGLAQRTIWAAPDNYSLNLNLTGEKPYLVIPSAQLELLPGDVQISAYGPETVFLALGTDSDALAWVGQSSHYLTVNTQDGSSLAVREIVGDQDFESPLRADIWKTESVGQGMASITVPAALKLAVVVASDGFDPAPTRVRISWPIETSTVVSDIFISVGSAFLLAAIILNLLALRKMLINRGPRRKLPKAPQGPKYRPKKSNPVLPAKGRRSARNKLAILPAGLILTLTLSGCSLTASVPTPTSSPTPTSTEAVVEQNPPVVSNEQVKRILRDIQETVSLADESQDLNLLKTRVAGPALKFRQVHYTLMGKSAEYEPPEPISGSVVSITLPAATNLWPRTVMLITESDSGLPNALVLQQASPRENYKLWYNIPLLPGSEIPAVPAADVGAIPVDSESLFLKVSPKQLAETFGDVIDKGEGSEFFNLFNLDGDEFYEQISNSQKEQIKKLKRAEITFNHGLGDPNVLSLSTSDAGALVAIMMTDTYTIKPTRDNAAVTVTGIEELLLGLEGSATGVRTQYGDMLLFYVPATNSDAKITLLGATQSILSIRVL